MREGCVNLSPHMSTCTQRTKANEGALESSCRVVNGLITSWVGGVGLVEQWRHHVALFAHSNSFWPEIEVPHGKTHNYTRTQRTKASEGALESSCRDVNGLDAGRVGGVGLVEQWRSHVAPDKRIQQTDRESSKTRSFRGITPPAA